MKKTKLNSFLSAGKKAALIAMLAAMPLSKAKAYDGRAYMSPSEQNEYQSYGVLPDDISDAMADAGADMLVFLLLCSPVIVGLAVSSTEEKKNKEKLLEQQQNTR